MATAASRRFSWSANRRTIALGLAAAAAVTAAVIVSLPHHESARHRALVAYIHDVDAVEARMNYSLTKVFAAYQAFAHANTVTPRTRAQLAQAETTLTTLRRQVAAVSAPADAVQVRVYVLRLIAGEAEVTHEVNLLARFSPSFSALLARLQRAATKLGRTLSAIKTPTPHAIRGTKPQIAKAQAAFNAASSRAASAQADAVTAYDAVVLDVLAAMRKLSPPPVLAPAFRSEVNGLVATHHAAERLAATLRQKNRSNVSTLARSFTIATRSSQTVAAQRTEIAAVEAYNARVRRVRTEATAVQRELARLQQSVH